MTCKSIAGRLGACLIAAAATAVGQAESSALFELLGRGRFDECIEQGKAALEARPDDAAVHHVLGRAYIHRDVRRAVVHLKACLERPTRPAWMTAWTHVALGEAYGRLGQTPLAKEHLREAVRLAATANATQRAEQLLRDLTPGENRVRSFKFVAHDGTVITPEAFRGRAVVMKFGPTWCGGCQRDARAFEALRNEWANRSVDFVTVVLGEPASLAEDFERHYRIEASVLVDPAYSSRTLFHVRQWPTYVVIDANGTIVGRRLAIDDELKRLIAKAVDTAEEGARGPTIARPGPDDERAPQIAVGRDGVPWVVSVVGHGRTAQVRLARFDRKPATDGIRVSAPDTWATHADVAIGSRGDLWVAWVARIGDCDDIFVRSFNVRGEASPIRRVTTGTADSMRPAITVDGRGRVWVAYYRWATLGGTSRDRNVFARYLERGEWSDETEVSPPVPAVDDHTDPDIVADPSRRDRVWIAWSWDYHSALAENTLDVDQPTIFVRAFEPSGPVTDPIPVRTPAGANAIDLRPKLGVDAAGTVYCAYDSWNRGKRSVMVFAGGQRGFKLARRLRAEDGTFAAPVIAVTPDDRVLIAYCRRGAHETIAMIAFEGGRRHSPSPSLESSMQRSPAVACGADGRWWLAYEVREGDRSRIVAIPVDR